MSANLHELADAVVDEATFVRFVSALGEDWQDECGKEAEHPSPAFGRGANGWENGTIGAFLEAATAWAESSKNGLEFYEVPPNPWRRAAHILLAGKFYE